jgi:hypothetical protein
MLKSPGSVMEDGKWRGQRNAEPQGNRRDITRRVSGARYTHHPSPLSQNPASWAKTPAIRGVKARNKLIMKGKRTKRAAGKTCGLMICVS